MISFFIACLWFYRIVRNILSYVHLWYVKEYRPDRMFIHLKTNQGKLLYFLPFKKPPVSPKTIFLVSTLIGCAFFSVFYLPFPILVNALIADILSFPLSFLLILILRIPTSILHTYRISRAVRLLRMHKPMIVIGVTGSFGKTSTKDFLYDILSTKYRVLKTEASKNSPIGIAEVVLKSLKPTTEVFIVEMGAYKRGEIAKMTSMVRPQIGIITAINAQHQDLFKTIDTTMKAKYELIEGLCGQKIAIMNADNTYVQQMMQWAIADKKHVWVYSEKNIPIKKIEKAFLISNIQSTVHSISYRLKNGNETYKIDARIQGQHFIQNLTGAVAASVASGMSYKTVCASVEGSVHPPLRMMELSKGPKGQNFINDTFNNNPDSAIAAISYMSTFSGTGKRIMVFQPMIELGKYEEKGHFDVGAYAAKYCDEVILTNSNFVQGFRDGVRSVNVRKKTYIMNPNEAADYIQKNTKKGDVILFKGKEAFFTLRNLT